MTLKVQPMQNPKRLKKKKKIDEQQNYQIKVNMKVYLL